MHTACLHVWLYSTDSSDFSGNPCSLFVCVCSCVLVYIYIYIYIYIYRKKEERIHATCLYVCVLHIHTYIRTHIRTYMHYLRIRPIILWREALLGAFCEHEVKINCKYKLCQCMYV